MSRQLDLDENQRQQLKIIMEKQGADSKVSRQRLKELRTEVHEISSSSDPSGSQARKVARMKRLQERNESHQKKRSEKAD